MKMGLLELLNANPFAGLDHEDPYTNLLKFYEIYGALEVSKTKEEDCFHIRLLAKQMSGI